ncbi:pyridoxamine 5'-phosphate oxidase [Rhodobacteraceae bacterium CCMM004]|nr:pyridoxamine 5'-phosphate oxidase [Rhodobacteraceae bacterium CCMM004]
MSEADADLAATWAAAWEMLETGVREAEAPARLTVLATGAQGGGGAARMVVLRGADRAAGTLEIHTDARSGKIAELRAAPRATLVFWDPGRGLQLRAVADVAILDGAATAERWARMPEAARSNYGGAPPPGTPIASPDAHRPGVEADRFAVLVARIVSLETLRLAGLPHRRARFDRAQGFAGRWLVP